MKNKKTVMTLALVGALALTVWAGADAVLAEEAGFGYPPFVQKLAERFGLDETEVEEFFDEERADHQARGQEMAENRLNQAVEDGLITAEQKELIIAKKNEMRDNAPNWSELDPEARQELREQHREEIKTWSEENGIELPLLFGQGEKGHRMGRFGQHQ